MISWLKFKVFYQAFVEWFYTHYEYYYMKDLLWNFKKQDMTRIEGFSMKFYDEN